jgi:hypothetical protein
VSEIPDLWFPVCDISQREKPQMTESTGHRIPTRNVAQRYGVSTRSVERWAADSRLKFPKPLVINRLKYWLEDDLVEWERNRAAASVAESAAA